MWLAGTGLFECEQVERARRYHRPLYLAAAGAIALNLGVLALLTFSVLGDHVYAATSGWAWWARVLAFTLLVLTLTALVGSPIAFWAGYVHEHAWSLSTQSAGGWFLDRMKGLAVNLVLGAGALLGIAAAARAWPALWPAIVAAAAAAFVLILSFVAPVILEPLFSRFTSLTDLELAGSLRSLADRAGLPVQRILVADASRRTRKLNAYVSGLGRTRRIVLFDTLLADASGHEAELVVAHELGHRRAHHLAKSTLLGMLGASAFVIVAWGLLRWPARRQSIGAASPADPRMVPFLLLLASVLGLLASPLGAALSRRWERQADVFSLELTRDLETFESTHRRLALSNLADLDPPQIVYLAWFSHPTSTERITAARTAVHRPRPPGSSAADV
ncbi:MAG: M48 family peptidase [Actinobacteria bacterium]|nr:MAG: M48 family peptidase [Actinomycetota bacterium]